jgi:hypothetical protein
LKCHPVSLAWINYNALYGVCDSSGLTPTHWIAIFIRVAFVCFIFVLSFILLLRDFFFVTVVCMCNLFRYIVIGKHCPCGKLLKPHALTTCGEVKVKLQHSWHNYMCPFICLFIFIYLNCLCIYLYIYLSVWSVCLSVCPSVRPPVRPSVPSMNVSLHSCLSCLSFCLIYRDMGSFCNNRGMSSLLGNDSVNILAATNTSL